jgi:hypothetical protein
MHFPRSQDNQPRRREHGDLRPKAANPSPPGGTRKGQDMDHRKFFDAMFAKVDARDADQFADCFTDDGSFRFGNLAYSADIKNLPTERIGALAGLDVWIVDALRKTPHPSHFNLDEALAWIARIKPKRAILTNLHTHMDYASLRSHLPPGVEPGFDGMSFAAG